MSQIKVNCPECHKSVTLETEILQQNDGKAVCSHCFHIFKLVKKTPKTAAGKKQPAPAAAKGKNGKSAKDGKTAEPKLAKTVKAMSSQTRTQQQQPLHYREPKARSAKPTFAEVPQNPSPTVFNLLGKNDRIEIEAFDDPDVHGVSCFLSYAKKGGLRETVNLEEDASDASVSCVQTAPQVTFNERVVAKPRQVFKRNASFAFKSLQIMRYYDAKRKAFAYMVYSDKIIQGSPKNSLSAFSCYSAPAAQPAVAASEPGRQTFGGCVIETAQ